MTAETFLLERERNVMALTKAEIIKNLHAESNFPKERCAELVESVFELMKDELVEGSPVLISRFGKWSVKKKNHRRGRDPQTGEELILDARRVVTFKCARKLKESLNSHP
jgi:integration host factor subunit alpha